MAFVSEERSPDGRLDRPPHREQLRHQHEKLRQHSAETGGRVLSRWRDARSLRPTPQDSAYGRAARLWSTAVSGILRSGSKRSRSEEHTSELQSRRDLVCRLLL